MKACEKSHSTDQRLSLLRFERMLGGLAKFFDVLRSSNHAHEFFVEFRACLFTHISLLRDNNIHHLAKGQNVASNPDKRDSLGVWQDMKSMLFAEDRGQRKPIHYPNKCWINGLGKFVQGLSRCYKFGCLFQPHSEKANFGPEKHKQQTPFSQLLRVLIGLRLGISSGRLFSQLMRAVAQHEHTRAKNQVHSNRYPFGDAPPVKARFPKGHFHA